MNYFRLVLLLFVASILIIGCQKDPNFHPTTKQQHNIRNTSTENVPQDVSKKAKTLLEKDDRVSEVQAINDKKYLVIAVSVPHMQRFKLDTTKKNLDKQLKRKFPNHKVIFSTDKKIFLELEQLEKEIHRRQLTPKKTSKKLKHIVGLSKEET